MAGNPFSGDCDISWFWAHTVPISHFYHHKVFGLYIQSMWGRQADGFSWEKKLENWKTVALVKEGTFLRKFVGRLGNVKVDCNFILYMHYSGNIQWPNRLLSNPGSKPILEPDIQGMKWLCEVKERTIN